MYFDKENEKEKDLLIKALAKIFLFLSSEKGKI